MAKLHIKKGDTVYVNSGEDKGNCEEEPCHRRRHQYGFQEHEAER